MSFLDDKAQSFGEGIATLVIEELAGRNGFDDWWWSLDAGIRIEIEDTLSTLCKHGILHTVHALIND